MSSFADADLLEVGDQVLAIGNPFGVGQTVTSGIVSALARTRLGISDYQFFIQTDAAINPGNSGGALVDMQGRLVGINTAIFSKSGGSQGIGFAIPANMVKLISESALQGGTVRRPWLGASLAEVSPQIANAAGLDRASGALVSDVMDSGPAATGGLHAGDIIASVDGKDVSDPNAFAYRFTTRGTSGEVELEVLRAGTRRKISVPLRTAPESPPRDIRDLSGNNPLGGAKVANSFAGCRGRAFDRRHERRRGRGDRGLFDRATRRRQGRRHHLGDQRREGRYDKRPGKTRRQRRAPVAHDHQARRPNNTHRHRRVK